MFKICLILLVLSINLIWAQDTPNSKLSSYEGLNFLIGFMENESNIADPTKLLEQKVFIAASRNANIEVTMGNMFPAMKYQLLADQVMNLDVPKIYENSNSEVIQKNLIEIKSDVPITVYCFSSIPRSTDSYTAIPIANWGKEYRIVSIANDQYNKITLDSLRDLTPRSSEFMVMAAYDDTEVYITPKSLTRKQMQVDQTYKVVLNKGQSYLVQSWQFPRGMGDLSGSVVKSTKPIGVLSGHVRTALLQGFVEQPPDSKDHIIEMLPPVSSWGMNYLTIPFGTSPNKGDYFKIIAKDIGTKINVITESGTEQINFIGNETVKVVTGINKPTQWISNAPILLAQFMCRSDDTLETHYYDPSMVIVPPIEQYVSKVILQAPTEVFQYVDGEKFTNHYINIIADSAAMSSLKYNDVSIQAISNIADQEFLTTNLYWAKIEIGKGRHILKADSGKFSGIIYGIGRYDSYAMALGSSLQNPFTNDNIPPVLSYSDSCDCLNGIISDEISEKSYGIYYAYAVTDSTNNFNVVFDPFAPNMTEIHFTACPIDKSKDGKLMIEYMDKNGNTRIFKYNYNARNIAYNSNISIGTIDAKDSICIDYKITNNGNSDRVLEFANIFNDKRITLDKSIIFPIVIRAKETISLKVCINGSGEASTITGKLALDFGCAIRDTIPIIGNIISINMYAEPYDFGKVLLGDTVCSNIKLINNSSIDILIKGLLHNSNLQTFIIKDTNSLFPYNLRSGDTLLINICFVPNDRVDYYSEIKFITEYSFTIPTYVKGLGAAPIIPSEEIDWGKRRVGTTNDSSITIYNNGNYIGILNFINFLSKSIDDTNSITLSSINNLSINEFDSSAINLSFRPSLVGNYNLEAEYSTNWKQHQNVIISLKGIGTLPIIKTNDFVFDTTEIYNIRDSIAFIVASLGNEKLNIDSIVAIQGDSNSFDIDYLKLKNISILENNNLSIPIRFLPTKLGYHELILEVTHDANPNYERSKSYIKISGTAVEPTNSDIEISIITNQTYICLLDTAIVNIKNNGKSNVDISNLKINADTNIILTKILDFQPSTIKPNEEKSYKILVYTEKNKGGKVKVIATFFDNLEKEIDFDYYPTVNQLSIDLKNDIKYSVGDTVVLSIEGEYPNRSDHNVNFYLKLDIKNEYLYLIDFPHTVDIITNNGVQTIDLIVNQHSDYIEFISDELIKLDSKAAWKFDLKFLGLLSPSKDSVWNISFTSDRCFDAVTENISSELNDICVFNVRHIKLITDIFMTNIYPNPIKERINLKVIMPEDDNIEIDIFNEKGENIIKNKLFSLKKGIHFVSLDFGNVPNGLYFLNVRKRDKINNLKFVKIN